jgi:hypothetical protein
MLALENNGSVSLHEEITMASVTVGTPAWEWGSIHEPKRQQFLAPATGKAGSRLIKGQKF